MLDFNRTRRVFERGELVTHIMLVLYNVYVIIL
jgi:hypothetical protein